MTTELYKSLSGNAVGLFNAIELVSIIWFIIVKRVCDLRTHPLAALDPQQFEFGGLHLHERLG